MSPSMRGITFPVSLPHPQLSMLNTQGIPLHDGPVKSLPQGCCLPGHMRGITFPQPHAKLTSKTKPPPSRFDSTFSIFNAQYPMNPLARTVPSNHSHRVGASLALSQYDELYRAAEKQSRMLSGFRTSLERR